MAAKGISVDELYASIGLDISELDSDFIDADKTVKQNLARLRSESNTIKLKMDVDIASLGNNASQTDVLRIKEQALTEQLHMQQQALILVQREYENTVKAKGANSYESQRLQDNYLREQKALIGLNNQLQIVKGQQSGLQVNKATGLSNAFDAFQGKNNGGGILDTFSGIGDKILGAQSAVIGFVGAFKGIGLVKDIIVSLASSIAELSMQAVQAGENAYQLSKRMKISASEAGQLGNMMAMGGVEVDTLYKTMARLDRQLLSTSNSGGTAKKALDDLGVSLTDAEGNILPVNQQLEQLAIAYQRAAAQGKEEQFIVETLGARGQQLVPILREMQEIKQATANIEPPNIDIEQAHRLTYETKELDKQFKNLKTTIGAAFGPLMETIIPAVSDGIKKLHQLLKDAGTIGRSDEEIAQIKKIKEEQRKADQEKKDAETEYTSLSNEGLSDDFKKMVKEQEKAEQERLKATQAINDETYKLTHNNLDNQILDLQRKVDAYREKGVTETEITALIEAQRAKIIDDYNKNTLGKLNEVYNTELDNRLANIEKEKQAWQQKGVDEVSATQWAETQKQDAVRNAAINAIKHDKARLDAYKQAVKEAQGYSIGSGIDANGNRVEFKFQNKNAVNDLFNSFLAEDRKQAGLKEGDRYTASDIQGFQQMLKTLKDNLIPGLEANPTYLKGSNIVNSPNITVNIDQPIVRDNGDITSLADQVADKIQPAIEQALGGQGNGY